MLWWQKLHALARPVTERPQMKWRLRTLVGVGGQKTEAKGQTLVCFLFPWFFIIGVYVCTKSFAAVFFPVFAMHCVPGVGQRGKRAEGREVRRVSLL